MLRSRLLLLTPLLVSIASAQGTFIVTAESTTVTCTRFHQTGFWDVDIDNYPALPPECGPPLSYNAIRDPSKLPIQICAIVAAYLFFLVATGTLLITWGRRLRKRAQLAVGEIKQEFEMINKSHYDVASPATSQRSWMKGPLRGLKHLSNSSSKLNENASPIVPKSPGMESINSFDNRVLVKDRETAQAEMDRLYAAVAAHEEARRSQMSVAKQESRDSIRSSTTVALEPLPPMSPPKNPAGEGRRNLRVQISSIPPLQIPASPRSAVSQATQGAPKSPYRPVYPPQPSPGGYSFVSSHHPMTPMTPFTPGRVERVELPDDMYPASPPPKQVRMQLPPKQFPMEAPKQFPMDLPPKSSDGEPAPTKASRKVQFKTLRIETPVDDDRQPLTPRMPGQATPGYQLSQPMSARTFESDDYASERLDEPKPLPLSRPTLTLPSSPKVTRSPVNALPLRAYASTESFQSPLSPGPVKQTILERKPNPVGRGPMTARTPRTGVPMTPYTPYMPFTPITPVTPGLMSRKMRKERIKAQGRKVISEEDEVPDEEEMWQG